MKIRKFLLSAIAITLVMSTLSGCSFLAAKKVLNDSDEVFDEEITQIEETENTKDDNGFFEKLEEKATEEPTTKREYVEINNINSIEEFKNLVSPLIDLSAYDISEYETLGTLGVGYTMKEEVQKQTKYNFKYKVSLDNKTEFSLPTTIGELKSQGWSLPDFYDYNKYSEYIMLTNSNGNEIELFIDPSSSRENIDEYIVTGYAIEDQNIEYTLFDKITEKSDFIEIIEHLGAPAAIEFVIPGDESNNKGNSVSLYYFEGSNGNWSKLVRFDISSGETGREVNVFDLTINL